MSNEKRYVAYPASCRPGSDTPDDAIDFAFRQNWWPTGMAPVVYEVGPEVKEPDYGPLVEWASGGGRGIHRPDCNRYNPNSDRACTCGLADALKAAGIE